MSQNHGQQRVRGKTTPRWVLARPQKVRVPNPAKPVKERLDAPPAKAHRSKKAYRRKPKHQGKDEAE